MNMKLFTKLCLSLIFTFLAANTYGQDMAGYSTSNYAGVSGIDLQPASIADMRYKFDMTLSGAGFDLNNNYSGDFETHFLNENTSTVDKAVGLNMYAQLPSFAISLSKNISIGFTWKIR